MCVLRIRVLGVLLGAVELGVRECAQFFNYFPSLPILDSCSTPSWSWEPCRIFLSNRNLSWTAPGSGICSSISMPCWWLSSSWKNTGWKCPQSSSGPPAGSQPAQVSSWKAKGKQAKVEMYEDVLEATPVCPIRGCALCGELQLEAGGSTSSSGFVLAQWIKPAKSAWEISVCSSTSQLALSCCFLGEKELLKPKQCTQPATAMRIKRNSQGNIS